MLNMTTINTAIKIQLNIIHHIPYGQYKRLTMHGTCTCNSLSVQQCQHIHVSSTVQQCKYILLVLYSNANTRLTILLTMLYEYLPAVQSLHEHSNIMVTYHCTAIHFVHYQNIQSSIWQYPYTKTQCNNSSNVSAPIQYSITYSKQCMFHLSALCQHISAIYHKFPFFSMSTVPSSGHNQVKFTLHVIWSAMTFSTKHLQYVLLCGFS